MSEPPSDSFVPVDDDLLALDLARDLRARVRQRLLERFEAGGRLIGVPPDRLRGAVGGDHALAEICARSIREAARRLAAERLAMRQLGCRLVARHDPAFPRLLRSIPDPPLLLRVRGRLPAAPGGGSHAALAIVGSRRPTSRGRRWAASFARAFVESGFHVVSGGARGIDAVAHRAALEVDGPTCSVLGSGLARPYPPEHASLFDSIVESGGCVLSEYPMDTGPRPALFPRRNRIVSGLSVGVLVVEAAARSGALITARLAVEEQGREALALPGRLDDSNAAGCLRMIREGWAALVRSPEEALESLEGAPALVAADLTGRGGAR